MSDPVFFPAGTILKGYIRGVPGWHGSLRFEFKPLSTVERNSLIAMAEKQSADVFHQTTRRLLLRQLVSWDATHEGQLLERNEESCDGLHPKLYQRLKNIVFVFEPSDLEEQATPQEVDEFLAAFGSDDPARDREEAQRKN